MVPEIPTATKKCEGGAVMRLLKLVPLFSFLLMLGGQFTFPPGQAYAGCCLTCPCMAYCICPGVGSCRYFYCPPHQPDDSTVLQVQRVPGNETLDIRANYNSPTSPALTSTSVDRLITVTSSGQCAKSNFRMKLLQSVEVDLKFEPDFLKYNTSKDNNIVAFQQPMNGEK